MEHGETLVERLDLFFVSLQLFLERTERGAIAAAMQSLDLSLQFRAALFQRDLPGLQIFAFFTFGHRTIRARHGHMREGGSDSRRLSMTDSSALIAQLRSGTSLDSFSDEHSSVVMREMTEEDVVRIVRSYIEGLFPKVCPKCGTQFDSLRDYLQLTTHMGSPHFFEPDGDGPTPDNAVGPIAHATCLCGYTMTIGSNGLPKDQLVKLIDWARAESQTRSISTRTLLRYLRDRIDEEVLRTDHDGRQERRRSGSNRYENDRRKIQVKRQ